MEIRAYAGGEVMWATVRPKGAGSPKVTLPGDGEQTGRLCDSRVAEGKTYESQGDGVRRSW
jgi:hypothetical protein